MGITLAKKFPKSHIIFFYGEKGFSAVTGRLPAYLHEILLVLFPKYRDLSIYWHNFHQWFHQLISRTDRTINKCLTTLSHFFLTTPQLLKLQSSHFLDSAKTRLCAASTLKLLRETFEMRYPNIWSQLINLS